MVYLIDRPSHPVRPAPGSGPAQPWAGRSIDHGRHRHVQARRRTASSSDPRLLANEAFGHQPTPRRRDIGIRSMVVAPLAAGDEVFGALGTFSSRYDAFSESDIRLVRALSDHAAAAMANARLIEALDASRREVAARADVERTLREIAARISAATDMSAVLQLSVEEAARLMGAEGSRIDLVDPTLHQLRAAYAAGTLQSKEDFARTGRVRARPGGGPGRRLGRVLDRCWEDPVPAPARGRRIHRGRRHPLGQAFRSSMDRAVRALLVAAGRRTRGPRTTPASPTIADQAAITIRTTRLIDAWAVRRSPAQRCEQALRSRRTGVCATRARILRDVGPGGPPGRGGRRDPRPARRTGQPAAGCDGLSDLFSAEERSLLDRSASVPPAHRGGRGPSRLADGDRRAVPAVAQIGRVLRAGEAVVAAPCRRAPLGVIEVDSNARSVRRTDTS